jgi:hypothetical protein
LGSSSFRFFSSRRANFRAACVGFRARSPAKNSARSLRRPLKDHTWANENWSHTAQDAGIDARADSQIHARPLSLLFLRRHEKLLLHRPPRCSWLRRIRRHCYRRQDLANGVGSGDPRHFLHPQTASLAAKNVHGEPPGEQCGPIIPRPLESGATNRRSFDRRAHAPKYRIRCCFGGKIMAASFAKKSSGSSAPRRRRKRGHDDHLTVTCCVRWARTKLYRQGDTISMAFAASEIS